MPDQDLVYSQWSDPVPIQNGVEPAVTFLGSISLNFTIELAGGETYNKKIVSRKGECCIIRYRYKKSGIS